MCWNLLKYIHKKRAVAFSLWRHTLSWNGMSRFLVIHLFMGETLLTTKWGRQAKEHNVDDMSLLSVWSKNDSSSYHVFRKESNNRHLYLPASGGTPLVGGLSCGSAGIGNLYDEMLVISLGVIWFTSFIQQLFIEYLWYINPKTEK